MKTIVKRVILSAFLLFTVTAATIYIIAPKELFRFAAAEPSERLPENSLAFINENFPNEAVMDVDLELTGFEVYLTGGIIIEFWFSGRARSVENMWEY